MYRSIIVIGILLLISSCNKHTKISSNVSKALTPIIYQEKPFEIKWKIERNSITKIPLKIKKQIKSICKNHNKVVLIKIKTYADDTAKGTFDCRI